MTRDDVIRRRLSGESDFRAGGGVALSRFGSRVRDEAGADSGLDVFVDPADQPSPDLAACDAADALVERAFPESPVGDPTQDDPGPVFRPHIGREALAIV